MVQSIRRARPLILVFLLLVVLAWAPWLTRETAETWAEQSFTAAWNGVIDGCGLQCNGCGATALHRLPFGCQVQLEYACGLIPADTPEYHLQQTAFVTFLGTVHGFDHP